MIKESNVFIHSTKCPLIIVSPKYTPFPNISTPK